VRHDYDVRSTEIAYQGRIIAVHRDDVAMPGGGSSQRDVVVHPGAVAVVALDDRRRVLLVNQYRHPVRRHLDELPAGLLDVDGEGALAAARRELAEEGGVAAATWHVLVDVLTSPGMSDEAIRLYLARDLTEAKRDVQEHEEVEMTSHWLSLEEAVPLVLAGRIENATACLGILATDRAVRDDFAGLRPPAAPWASGKAPG